MDPHISPEQRRKLAVGLLKSAIKAPPEHKESLIQAALLNLTSAESRDVQRGAPARESAADDHELNLPDARAQVRQLIKAALEAPTPEGLASFLDFANSFRRLSAWNAYMAYIQRPGASAIASEYEWKTVKRVVKADAVPIIVLWPRSPIRFVYELADTSSEIDRVALKDPFAVEGKLHPNALKTLQAGLAKQNAFQIEIELRRHGFHYAGSAAQQATVSAEGSLAALVSNGSPIGEFASGNADTARSELIRVAENGAERRIPSYRVTVNDRLNERERFATIAHELGHIFCGHLGGCNSLTVDDEGGWPNRTDLEKHEREIEAEAVAYLVCSRGGIVPASVQYLRAHAGKADIRLINLDLIVRAAGRIERLAKIRHGSIQFTKKKQPS
jgi:IrrE N-terminal-like domain